MSNPFQQSTPLIQANERLRLPQREAYAALYDFAQEGSSDREVGVILPVGCGKSGCITLTPFAFQSRRTLVIAPGISIAEQLHNDFNPSNPEMFYTKCSVLSGPPFPEPVEIRGTNTNRADLDEANVVITNIQQLQGAQNRWLDALPEDFFDLIVFDEGHHGVAASWENLKSKFPSAKIVNYSATPQRADGQLMAGEVIYTFPVSRAIQMGFVKSLKAVQLNPRSLRYVRREDGEEIEVDLEEVKRLGEQEADFRRSIVTSEETLSTIVDASIRELQRLRQEGDESRLKIIASALNYQHCHQIVAAYRARGLRAEFVHSREDSNANQTVMRKLEAHEIDVIVQVRKLGEGFDHPFLAVAAVCSIFSNLSPFIQFVGRIMRVIIQNTPDSPLNRGVVVFHSGGNIANQWSDFQAYSQADREYFDQLLPLEGLDPSAGPDESEYSPTLPSENQLEVREQDTVELEEIQLLPQDQQEAIRLLQESGIIPREFDATTQTLRPVPTTRVAERQALRDRLAAQIMTRATAILEELGINPNGSELDTRRLGRTNQITLKSAIDRAVNASVTRSGGTRSEFNRAELDSVFQNFETLVEEARQEVFDGN